MGFGTMFKANRALKAQKNGATDEAVRLYEECFAEGLNDARYVLPYAVLIYAHPITYIFTNIIFSTILIT